MAGPNLDMVGTDLRRSPARARLGGKVALITGSASGIGLATAKRFAAEGATVFLSDLSDENLTRALEALGEERDPHRVMQLDVTLETAWIAAMSEIDTMCGRLDILVNNAGYAIPNTIDATTLEEWRSVIAVNLDSVFLGTKYALPLLARSGRGSIVNISSIIGLVAGEKAASYAAAKAGVHLFTKVTALECAAAQNGVRANSVHPGQIETPLLTKNLAGSADARKAVTQRIPIGRLGEPCEIAEAIVFLASDEFSFMTGAEITIDGGYTAQ